MPSAAGPFAGAQAGEYVRALPDSGGQSTWGSTATIDYSLQISTPGVYRLWLRWDGVDGSSDSVFAGIVQLADGAGGVPDWYEDTGHAASNFNTYGWDGDGGVEQNVGSVSPQTAMIWTISTPGLYTLRLGMREDGAAVDAWTFALRDQPFAPVADSVTLHHGDKARMAVIANDLGFFDPTSVQIVTPPSFGTAVASTNGTVLYSHTSGTPGTDTFTYRLYGLNGQAPSPPATVSLNFTAAPRFESDFVNLPPEAPPTSLGLREAFAGITFNSPVSFASVPGDSQKLFVTEGVGVVAVIPDVTAVTPEKRTFLNITNRVQYDANELALKGIAFHPGYNTNGYFYVTYNSTSGTARLSRFTRSPTNSLVADPASEVILIDQVNQGIWHNVATCRFGPDGYLYVGFGDEGTQTDGYDNTQHVDKDIWSCIIRIDVDKRAGNREPNADSEIPRDGLGKAYFSVPADNPLVGITSFNGQPLNTNLVRTEIYVMGLRNPWQFAFLPGTNALLVGDVGRSDREEVSLLAPGQNGGWAWREGSIPGIRSGQLINGASEAQATLTGPIYEYSHAVGQAITAGLVYQGANYPGLKGRFIFADYVAGDIRAFDPANPSNTVQRLAGEAAITAFELDPSNNDILLLDRGNVGGSPGVGRVWRLVTGSDDSNFPQTVTQTGFFADLTDLTPNPGAVFYEPNLRFWSDYAEKKRWFLLQDTTSRVSYARDNAWTFPAGMIWVKHFDLDLERGNPATRKRIETRYLVKTATGSYGVSYKWNDAGTEAFLVADAGQEFDLTVTEGSTVRTQRWHIPSRTECRICHTPEAGHALSFNTRQLNRTGSIAGTHGNLLTLLSSSGYLQDFNDDPVVLPRHVRPDETRFSIESRARSYLAVNCAYCHQEGGTGPSSWDGRPELNLWQTRLVNGMTIDAPLDPAHRLIVPGSTNQSVVWNRIARANGYSRMPPVASLERDEQGIELLAGWIASQLPGRQDYAAWRLSKFGSSVSPEGAPGMNPDADPDSNQAEFLKLTNPNDANDYYRPALSASGSAMWLDLPVLSGRRVSVETSTDLGLTDPWVPWAVEGNNGMALSPGQTNRLSGPLDNPKRFFQIRFEEE